MASQSPQQQPERPGKVNFLIENESRKLWGQREESHLHRSTKRLRNSTEGPGYRGHGVRTLVGRNGEAHGLNGKKNSEEVKTQANLRNCTLACTSFLVSCL